MCASTESSHIQASRPKRSFTDDQIWRGGVGDFPLLRFPYIEGGGNITGNSPMWEIEVKNERNQEKQRKIMRR
jgi:hypothetical protein